MIKSIFAWIWGAIVWIAQTIWWLITWIAWGFWQAIVWLAQGAWWLIKWIAWIISRPFVWLGQGIWWLLKWIAWIISRPFVWLYKLFEWAYLSFIGLPMYAQIGIVALIISAIIFFSLKNKFKKQRLEREKELEKARREEAKRLKEEEARLAKSAEEKRLAALSPKERALEEYEKEEKLRKKREKNLIKIKKDLSIANKETSPLLHECNKNYKTYKHKLNGVQPDELMSRLIVKNTSDIFDDKFSDLWSNKNVDMAKEFFEEFHDAYQYYQHWYQLNVLKYKMAYDKYNYNIKVSRIYLEQLKDIMCKFAEEKDLKVRKVSDKNYIGQYGSFDLAKLKQNIENFESKVKDDFGVTVKNNINNCFKDLRKKQKPGKDFEKEDLLFFGLDMLFSVIDAKVEERQKIKKKLEKSVNKMKRKSKKISKELPDIIYYTERLNEINDAIEYILSKYDIFYENIIEKMYPQNDDTKSALNRLENYFNGLHYFTKEEQNKMLSDGGEIDLIITFSLRLKEITKDR